MEERTPDEQQLYEMTLGRWQEMDATERDSWVSQLNDAELISNLITGLNDQVLTALDFMEMLAPPQRKAEVAQDKADVNEAIRLLTLRFEKLMSENTDNAGTGTDIPFTPA